MFKLLFFFTVIPIVELWILASLSGYLGVFDTIIIVLGTGMIGAALARWQGFQAITRLQKEMKQGMIPARCHRRRLLDLRRRVVADHPWRTDRYRGTIAARAAISKTGNDRPEALAEAQLQGAGAHGRSGGRRTSSQQSNCRRCQGHRRPRGLSLNSSAYCLIPGAVQSPPSAACLATPQP